MTARFLVAAVVGVVAGFASGGTAGYQAFALTYGLTGFLDPAQKVQGPRLSDLTGPSANAGDPIAYCEGHPRVAGNYAWSSPKREIASTTSQGKGGPSVDSTNYTYEIDLFIVLSENPGFTPRRIWANGKLVWTAADVSSADSIAASADTISWRELRPYTGAVDQMPDPTYEAAVGVGFAPAMRGRSSVFIEGLNLGGSGYLPVLTFEITSAMSSDDGLNRLDVPFRVDMEDHAAPIAVRTVKTFGSGASIELITPPDPASGDYFVEFSGGRSLNLRNASFLKYEDSIVINAHPDYATPYTVEGEFEIVSTSTLPSESVQLGFSQEFFAIYNDANLPVCAFQTRYDYGNGVLMLHVELRMQPAGILSAETPAVIGGFNTYKFVIGNDQLVRFYLNKILLLTGNVPPPTYPGFFQVYVGPDGSAGTTAADRFRARNVRAYTGDGGVSVPLTDAPLDQVVLRQCLRGGLTADQVDVTALEGRAVRSMAVSKISSPRTVIESLMAAYLFEAVETGEQIVFVPRGGAPLWTVPFADLGASEGNPIDDPLPISRNDDLELAARVVINYANVDDDYQTGSEPDDRGITRSTQVTTVEIPLGLTATEAKRIANSQVMDIAASMRGVGPFAVTRKWSQRLKPTDVVMLQRRSGSLLRARLTKRTDNGGVLTYEALVDDASVIDSVSVTDTAYSGGSFTVVSPTPTAAAYLDIPILRDADNDGGFYAAATWERGGGFNLYGSPNDVDFSPIASGTSRSVVGQATTALNSWAGGFVWDESSSVSVEIGAGQLASSTQADILLGNAPAYLIGDEIVFARVATMLGEGVYRLSGFLRGRVGTDGSMSGHIAGERFVVLDTSLRRVALPSPQVGIERFYKAVTFGRRVADTSSTAFTGHARGLRPLAPVDARAERLEGGDIRISWRRRTRFVPRYGGAAGVSVPWGETIKSFQVTLVKDGLDFSNILVYEGGVSSDPFRQNLDVSAPAALLTADMQINLFGALQDVVHVKIFQYSEQVGNSAPLVATLRVA